VYEPKEVQLMMNDRQWIVASELCLDFVLDFCGETETTVDHSIENAFPPPFF
jgi:hypothetical protein